MSIKKVQLRYDRDDYEPESLTENGGELWTVSGRNTSGNRSDKNRRITVKHYAGGLYVNVGIGPENKQQARASIQLDYEDTEELIICLFLALLETNKVYESITPKTES